MDPGRRAMISGGGGRRESPSRDITAPRRDHSSRVSKPSAPSSPKPDFSSRPQNRRLNTNTTLEDEQSKKWVSQEDSFVLKQAKKKAYIRVREGRAKPIDWLAVIARVVDPDRDLLDSDDEEEGEDRLGKVEIVDPEGVFEGLSEEGLEELEGEIKAFEGLEKEERGRSYWGMMRVICKDKREKILNARVGRDRDGRVVSSVASDVDKLLGPKTFDELEKLEKQISAKLSRDESIDTDYWEQLLRSLIVWKAKARLKIVIRDLLGKRLDGLRKKQEEDAHDVRGRMQELLGLTETAAAGVSGLKPRQQQPVFEYDSKNDPEPILKLHAEDKAGEVLDESVFLKQVVAERKRIFKLGYVPSRQTPNESLSNSSASKAVVASSASMAPPGTQRFSAAANEDFSQATKALYEREVARGIDENEEIFTAEESVASSAQPQWAGKYRPRKPKYFNRVQMGYEWNKYNQTHYDHDNPPPKVVQGYKFNIFYPDLIDKAKAPTYRIIREHGRKRGESFAPAGEEDTCLIRFIAGPPYEDIAFRIVDKEWDHSAKRDRGFRSSFDKGILQLHFQYKKIYYRK